jgi:hypothetical protein
MTGVAVVLVFAAILAGLIVLPMLAQAATGVRGIEIGEVLLPLIIVWGDRRSGPVHLAAPEEEAVGQRAKPYRRPGLRLSDTVHASSSNVSQSATSSASRRNGIIADTTTW